MMRSVMRILIIVASAVLLFLLTFFGIGPVVFADGSMQERIITAVIVVILMFGVIFATKWGLKRFPKNK